MRLEFKYINGKFITEEGTRISSELLSSFYRKFNPDGSGYVDIPDGIGGFLIGGESIKVTGTGTEQELLVETLKKDFILDEKYKSNLTNYDPIKYILGYDKNQLFTEKNKPMNKKKESMVAHYRSLSGSPDPVKTNLNLTDIVVTAKPDVSEPQEGIAEVDAISAFAPVAIPTALSTLTTLGFEHRGNTKWFHPALGEDNPFDWFDFDVHSHNIQSLIGVIHLGGIARGKREVRYAIKAALDI